MKTTSFHHIGLIGRAGKKTADTLDSVAQYLTSKNIAVSIEANTAEMLQHAAHPLFSEHTIPTDMDLMIVIGGDGSLLNAAHMALPHDLPVLGINRGRLGFLTDIHPNDLDKIGEVLIGRFQVEKRFLLQADHDSTSLGLALNEVVLLPGDTAQLIEFDIFVDNQFVCHQRADGLIIATPTGSTAYALSGGGPILHPQLNAIVMVPMFPHTLSNRPIVVDGDAKIELVIHEHRDHQTAPFISCDGQNRIKLALGTRITVSKHPKSLRLIHPESYRYFETLREKLGWQV